MKWIISMTLLLSLYACSHAPQSETALPAQSEALVRYADHFQVFKIGDSLRLEIYQPDGEQVEYRQTFPISINQPKKIAALSATHIGMIVALDAEATVVGISNANYLANQHVLNRVKQGRVVELGEEAQIPVESILSTQCDVIVYSGFGKTFPHQKQLKQVGVDCIANYDWRESEPLGKAEWILFFGCLLGDIESALSLFQSVEKDYLSLKKIGEQFSNQPTILSGNLWGDNWHAPSGESFNAQLFADAGGQYIYVNTKGTGSQFYSLEKILADNLNTAYWFNTGFGSKAELLAVSNKLRLLGPFQQNQIFDYAQSGNVYWEESALYPNRVLSDLISILHRSEHNNSKFYYYSRVE